MDYPFLRHQYLIMDTCCVINICATYFEEDILKLLRPVMIAEVVRDDEAASLADDNDTSKEIPLDLSPLIENQLLTVVRPQNEHELNMVFTMQAMNFGKGEAHTGAIAMSRNWAIATDDKRFQNFVHRQTNAVQIVDTLHIIKYWVDKLELSWGQTRMALVGIAMRASYVPGKRHPLFPWWQSHISGS